MKSARQLLERKGYDVWSIGPEESVYAALERMAEKDVGALMVMADEELVGVLSERDYARKIILLGKTSSDTPVREIMTDRVVFVRPDQDLEACMAIMSSKRVRHLPVMEAGRVIGVISIGDVVKEVIAHQEFMIEQLENYISGSR
jgi:CBS domain-containing protein